MPDVFIRDPEPRDMALSADIAHWVYGGNDELEWADPLTVEMMNGARAAGYRLRARAGNAVRQAEDREMTLSVFKRGSDLHATVTVYRVETHTVRSTADGLLSDLGSLVAEALREHDTGAHPDSADLVVRAAIETLYREVMLGLVENDYLKALIDDLSAELAAVSGQLSAAQMEIKTLAALHAQLERQNEALLQELSKARVQPESASLLARGLKFGAMSLVSLAITVGGTYAGTKAALPDDQAAQLQQTQQVIVDQCDQVINVVGSGD